MTRPARSPGVRLEVSHETTYHYSAPVELAHHLAFLRPLEDEAQQLLDHTLRIEPTPSHRQTGHDAFRNGRSCFSITVPHRGLRVLAQSVVAVQSRHGSFVPADTPEWERVREGLRYQVGTLYDPASEFVFPSPMVPRLPPLGEYARRSFTPGRPIGEAALELMQRLHEDMRYMPASTDVATPVLEAFERREGVCQDFAHILIACLRTLGLSARYVSGYLLTEPPPGQPRLQGADASHAWAAVYCPGVEGPQGHAGHWIELDPTNNCLADLRHVRLARGRDFGDVSPLRGVIRGGGSHTLLVRVSTTEVQC